MVKIRQNDIIRAGIEKKLSELDRAGAFSSGKRVYIPRNMLEQALFDKITLSGATIKVPIWFGEFLSKIDLSRINFRNVAWSFFCKGELYEEYSGDPFYRNYFARVFKEGTKVVYKNTNARIDFTQSFEALHSKDHRAVVQNCDFSGTDLSNNFISCIRLAESSQFAHTNINFEGSLSTYYSSVIKSCSFRGNNLEGLELRLLPLLFHWGGNEDNDFSDTKLNFLYDAMDFSTQDRKCFEEMRNRFLSYLKKGYFNGCYLNGALIPTDAIEQEALVSRLFDSIPTKEGASLSFKPKGGQNN